ncbi:MAG TPA: ribosomal-processing cysteine protease Prp [Acetomicrobium flavidum]|uniref:ribosomal-processing cysteine protease Prp n=1 Tax=Acetomicrobium flavidum TaxID=49896 RepID=UPI002C1B2D0B|nr:ribosomal-processing cysteine protease Prp [Acetomicrobium flavidum]HPP14043.1 ribosomal-processing cysteine protease Prp [Acetomicrobium flavidum]
MIEVRISVDKKGPLSVQARGHSGYAPRGKDIVCAAVSTLMHALLLGLRDVVGIQDTVYEIDEEEPRFFILWRESDLEDDRSRAVIDTVLRSLRSIADSYPKYVHIVEVNKK